MLKFVATNNITMAVKGAKHISRAGAIDKRSINVTLCESLDGGMLPFQLIYTGKTEKSLPDLPFQLIYTGKTEKSLPDFTFPDGFCIAFKQKHWNSFQAETLE